MEHEGDGDIHCIRGTSNIPQRDLRRIAVNTVKNTVKKTHKAQKIKKIKKESKMINEYSDLA